MGIWLGYKCQPSHIYMGTTHIIMIMEEQERPFISLLLILIMKNLGFIVLENATSI